jgi:regulatory protein
MQKAIQFLSRQEYSQKQLYDKLSLHGYTIEDIENTIQKLQQKNLQSDARFAEMIARKHSYKGINKLNYTLKQHELSTEHHTLALNTLNTTGDEYTRIKMAWYKKFGRMNNIIEINNNEDEDSDSLNNTKQQQYKLEQKYIRFLLGQGFNYDMIRKFLRALQLNEEIFD